MRPPAISITGVHRSGTSMVAGVLHSCGIYFGEEHDLLPPSPANPEGYWENRHFVELDDALISALGGSWDSSPPIPERDDERWNEDHELKRILDAARALVGGFAGHEPWAFKDPRTCLTLPFWLSLLPDLRIVIPVRNPVEVAMSLRRVGACSTMEDGFRVWRLYVDAAFAAAPRASRIVCHVDACYREPMREVERLLTFLQLAPAEAVVEQAAATIKPQLRHSAHGADDLSGLVADPELVELYERVCEEAQWHDSEAPAKPAAARARPLAALEDELAAGREERAWARRMLRDQSELLAEVRRDVLDLLEHGRHNAASIEALRGEHRLLGEQIRALSNLYLSTPETRDKTEQSNRLVVSRVRALLESSVPPGATAAVVSRGDSEFLKVPDREIWHFPRAADGRYAGYYPSTGAAAVAHLEVVRAAGAAYLFIPASALWWLDHYEALDRHLKDRCERRLDDWSGVLYSLRSGVPVPLGASLRRILTDCDRVAVDEAVLLDLTALELESRLPDRTVFTPPAREIPLPYLDGTADAVAIDASATADELAEAQRVARACVILVPDDPGAAARVDWHIRREALTASLIVLPTRAPIPHYFAESIRDTIGDVCTDLIVPATQPPLPEALAPVHAMTAAIEGETTVAAFCNAAAATAHGDVLVFLDPRTILLEGWLDSLVETLSDITKAGAVGGLLRRSDGELVHAGGSIAGDGSLHDLDVTAAAEVMTVAEVDWASLSLFATRRELFGSLGGFDAEQTRLLSIARDYALRLRSAGYSTYRQPEAAAVFAEELLGASADVPVYAATAIDAAASLGAIAAPTSRGGAT